MVPRKIVGWRITPTDQLDIKSNKNTDAEPQTRQSDMVENAKHSAKLTARN